MISKSKKKDYLGEIKLSKFALEQEARSKSAIPGVGKYKEVERGLKILSRPPVSLRRLR
jgi:hypothetical protein